MEEREPLSPETVLRRVNKIKREIEEAKAERDKCLGRKEELLNQMKRDYGVGSLEEAKRRIKALDEQIMRRNAKIDRLFVQLQEKYEF